MSVDTSKFISLGGLVNFKTRQDVVNDEKLLKRQDVSMDENEIQIAISEQNVLRALTSNSTIQANKVSGVIDIEHIPESTLERIVQVANQAARYALTPSQVQEGDVVHEQDTGLMFFVMDSTKLSQAAGYQEFTAGAASSVPWSGVTSKPDNFTPSSHTHGNISNDGKIGSTGNLPVITGTDGIVQTGSFGNAANTFCEGNDSRLSDSRDPNDHASNKVTLMTGYSIPASTSAISASDSLNAAIGKLEKKEDNISAVSGSMADYAMAEETGAVSTSDQVVEALGKIEYKANYFATNAEIDEQLFSITVSEQAEGNGYIVTGLGLNAFVPANDGSYENIDEYDYPYVLSVNVAPGTCNIGGTTYSIPFEVLTSGIEDPESESSSGSSVFTVVATASNGSAALSLEEGDMSQGSLQSNQLIIGKVTLSASGDSASVSPVPSGTSHLVSGMSLNWSRYGLEIGSGVIDINGKYYRAYEDMGDPYDSYEDSLSYLIIPNKYEGASSSTASLRYGGDGNSSYPVYNIDPSDLRIYDAEGEVYTDSATYESDVSGSLHMPGAPFKLLVMITTENITADIPAGTDVIDVTGDWVSNGTTVHETRTLKASSLIQSGSSAVISSNAFMSHLDSVTINSALNAFIDISDPESYDSSSITFGLSSTIEQAYVVAFVRSNGFLAVRFELNQDNIGSNEVVLGRLEYHCDTVSTWLNETPTVITGSGNNS